MASVDRETDDLVSSEADGAARLLTKLIAYPSSLGHEEKIIDSLYTLFRGIGLNVQRCMIPESIRKDRDYTSPDREASGLADYRRGRNNLLGRLKGTGGRGRSLILQTHVDVVPAQDDWKEAFCAAVRGGVVRGRGAVDCKGQVVAIYLALKALRESGIRLRGDLSVHLVIEEEIGGNGALAMILDGHRADGVVVMEPTSLQVHPANKGVLFFRISLDGESAHMSRAHEARNSIDLAVEAIRLLKGYGKRLLAESRNCPSFTRYRYPTQVNVGMINGGIVPNVVPGRTIIEGGVGFLPNKDIKQIKTELKKTLLGSRDPWFRNHFKLEFPRVHNDAYEIPPDHPLALSLAKSCARARIKSDVFGWNGSCDARLYAKRGKMPTVVFGPGELRYAHSNKEQIRVKDILRAARALIFLIIEWCGQEPQRRNAPCRHG